eukprot:2256940-Pyramimonas_sp.AAC.1
MLTTIPAEDLQVAQVGGRRAALDASEHLEDFGLAVNDLLHRAAQNIRELIEPSATCNGDHWASASTAGPCAPLLRTPAANPAFNEADLDGSEGARGRTFIPVQLAVEVRVLLL